MFWRWDAFCGTCATRLHSWRGCRASLDTWRSGRHRYRTTFFVVTAMNHFPQLGISHCRMRFRIPKEVISIMTWTAVCGPNTRPVRWVSTSLACECAGRQTIGRPKPKDSNSGTMANSRACLISALIFPISDWRGSETRPGTSGGCSSSFRQSWKIRSILSGSSFKKCASSLPCSF